MRNRFFLTYLKKRFILILALLYLFNPLHKPLADGFHKLSHALTHTSTGHQHDLDHKLGREHSHDHEFISFFSRLFSNDDTPSDKNIVIESKYDKHILQQVALLKKTTYEVIEHQFFYENSIYKAELSVKTPPPKRRLS